MDWLNLEFWKDRSQLLNDSILRLENICEMLKEAGHKNTY